MHKPCPAHLMRDVTRTVKGCAVPIRAFGGLCVCAGDIKERMRDNQRPIFTDKRFLMSSYCVRPAAPRDAKGIAEIHVATWQAAYQGLIPAEVLKAMTVEKRLAYWKEAIEYSDPQILVALDNDKVIGFVGFDRSRDPGTKSSVGEIWAMYVTPEHWRKGAGLALWDGARDGLKEEGCTQVTLWVLLANERALQFYEQAAGFKREMPSLRATAYGSVKLEEIRLKRSVD